MVLYKRSKQLGQGYYLVEISTNQSHLYIAAFDVETDESLLIELPQRKAQEIIQAVREADQGVPVPELCKKHGITYREKPLLAAMGDIVASMKESGGMWRDAYHLDDSTKLGEHETPNADACKTR